MEKENIKRILVCPLGWGLGHASRVIPIIKSLLDAGYKVIAAGDSPQLLLISSSFPDIETIYFPSFDIRLSKQNTQLLPLIGIAFRLPYFTIKEHYLVKRIVIQNRIDFIISDNRYGLWCRGIKSILITHQLCVIFPKPFHFLESIGIKVVRFLANQYDYCFIPDFKEDDNLAGKLSHPSHLPMNVRYIGLLSRYNDFKFDVTAPVWDLVGIASGPSPQREIFIDLISQLAKNNNLKTLIIKGNPAEGMNIKVDHDIFYVGHLKDSDFAKTILSSKHLITRAGYSTIMDLATLGISCLIVPTPGQTEQEYLANYLATKGIFKTRKQTELCEIDISIAETNHIPSLDSKDFLEKALQKVMI